MAAANEEFDGQQWGDWECPECGETNSDPESIQETSCSCGAIVVLGCIDEWSGRTAKSTTKLQKFGVKLFDRYTFNKAISQKPVGLHDMDHTSMTISFENEIQRHNFISNHLTLVGYEVISCGDAKTSC